MNSLNEVESRQKAGPTALHWLKEASAGCRSPHRLCGAGAAGVAQVAKPHPERSQGCAAAGPATKIPARTKQVSASVGKAAGRRRRGAGAHGFFIEVLLWQLQRTRRRLCHRNMAFVLVDRV